MSSANHTSVLRSEEVAESFAAGRPVVAIESTIITHGMPYPHNVQTALLVEETIREQGATPATMAVIDGRLRAGVSSLELEQLASLGEGGVKIGAQNLAAAVHRGDTGGTTVATTMRIAHMVGIRVFATGGIGGVHRGASETFDISGDLQELAKTPVAVVSAGFKSILDIALTVQYLETRGVPIVGYGTEKLPAFYTADSPYPVSLRLDSPDQVGDYLNTHWDLNPHCGVVVANPIPKDAEIPAREIDEAVEEACRRADELNISGQELTPFLLDWLATSTANVSLEANKRLVANNASVAAQIAAHV
ncbi:MAG: pseudouridine-5'-phosphate glycosidase [Acidimicrobiia bacterium]